MPYELNPRDVEQRFVTCELLLQRQKNRLGKVFCVESWLTLKSGFTAIIQSVENRGLNPDVHKHRPHNQISMVRSFLQCCSLIRLLVSNSTFFIEYHQPTHSTCSLIISSFLRRYWQLIHFNSEWSFSSFLSFISWIGRYHRCSLQSCNFNNLVKNTLPFCCCTIDQYNMVVLISIEPFIGRMSLLCGWFLLLVLGMYTRNGNGMVITFWFRDLLLVFGKLRRNPRRCLTDENFWLTNRW